MPGLNNEMKNRLYQPDLNSIDIKNIRMQDNNKYVASITLCILAALLIAVQPAFAQRRSGANSRSSRIQKPARTNTARDVNIKNRSANNNIRNRNSNNRTVNVNIDNSHNRNNTVVRRNHISTYSRPPYFYGGRRYYAYHPYIYHPFRPYVWGPMWHPWGFFITTLAATAIIVEINNAHYHYAEGVWYIPAEGGYIVAAAPVGGTVTNIPADAEQVTVNNVTNYYYGGSYYEKDGEKYKVVAPPAGAVVKNLPEGGEEVKVGDQTYVKVGETYYQPIDDQQYEVVQIEEGEK